MKILFKLGDRVCIKRTSFNLVEGEHLLIVIWRIIGHKQLIAYITFVTPVFCSMKQLAVNPFFLEGTC